MKIFRTFLFVLIAILTIVTLTHAAIPKVINYQGKFTDKNDNPLSGNYLVTFRFYDVASGGEPMWEEGHILTVNKGRFNALLGSIKPLDVDFGKDLWLGIEVASDGEMSPRIKLASSAYAFNAKTIDMLESSQLLRNDIDAVMSGDLTLKKDLILRGNLSEPSKMVLTDAKGSEYYLWIDTAGRLRIKKGAPVSLKDGAVVVTEIPGVLSGVFMQRITFLLILVVLMVFLLILYSMKKKK